MDFLSFYFSAGKQRFRVKANRAGCPERHVARALLRPFGLLVRDLFVFNPQFRDASYISDIDVVLGEHVTVADGWLNHKLVCFKLDFLQADSSALSGDLLGVNSGADLI